MNRGPLNSLALSKAITGFVNYKTAEGLSERSVDAYRRILALGKMKNESISKMIVGFL